jgi:hypothetical protein
MQHVPEANASGVMKEKHRLNSSALLTEEKMVQSSVNMLHSRRFHFTLSGFLFARFGGSQDRVLSGVAHDVKDCWHDAKPSWGWRMVARESLPEIVGGVVRGEHSRELCPVVPTKSRVAVLRIAC